MRNLAAPMLLLSLVACDSPGGTSATSSATSAAGATASVSASPSGKYCEKAEALQARLSTIDVKISRVGLPTDLTIPEGTEGMPFPVQSTVIVVTAEGYSVGGTKIARAAELATTVRLRNVLFAIAKDAPHVDRVFEAAAAFPPETSLYLLASVPNSKREPAPASIKTGGVNDSERAVQLATLLSKSIDGCEPVAKFFKTLAAEDPDSRAPRLRDKLPSLVDQCQCKVGDDAVDILAYLLGGDAPVVAKRIVLSKEKTATAIDLKKMDGQKLFDALPKDGSPIRL